VKRFHIQNFGCRATQADGAALASLLEKQGLSDTGSAREADLVILNTCTVTAAADEDVRKAVHRVHRENPSARILVTGCYAQRAPEELKKMPGVAWVIGNSHKASIPALLPSADAIIVGDLSCQTSFLSAPVEDASGDRTRPNLKIQDGCNQPCSYCIIPEVRGPSRSMAANEVVNQVRGLAGNFREVVLTGINLGRWGREPGFQQGSRPRLAGLIQRLLDETPVERLRLSSIEPMDLSDDLLEVMAASARIARHVHAPLQSGSDSVLKRMHRRYRARHYEERLLKAHALMPDAAFGADVMTGFPGETDAEFEETCALVRRLPFTYLHVFTYSERPGTPAAALPAVVPHPLRKERTRLLRHLAAQKNLAYRRHQLGGTLSVVTLGGGKAISSNYLSVELARPRQENQLIDVQIGSITRLGLGEFGLLPVLNQD
jgi:threonylcarbamoyladenosine tRNA methylthiotransferase MtaB